MDGDDDFCILIDLDKRTDIYICSLCRRVRPSINAVRLGNGLVRSTTAKW